jgi:apolipoprotein N-acyltransferase
LSGIVGVGFIIAAVNGLAADILHSWAFPSASRASRRLPAYGVNFVLVLAGFFYGYWRLGQARATEQTGPRVALVQVEPGGGCSVKSVAIAVESSRADIVVFPETSCVLPDPQGADMASLTSVEMQAIRAPEGLARIARGSRTTIIAGTLREKGGERFNSSIVYTPESLAPAYYDKVQVLPFAESIPFDGWGGRRWARWSGWNYAVSSFTPGKTLARFASPVGSANLTFATPICSETFDPEFIRRLAYGEVSRKVQALIVPSNDGAFADPQEWQLHLAVGVFRAIENRIAVAVASTTMSAIVSPSGVVTAVANGKHPQIVAGTLTLDARITPFQRWGDWIHMVCVSLVIVVVIKTSKWRTFFNRVS